MDKAAQYLISKDNGKLQLAYKDYLVLMEKVEEAKRIRTVKNDVLALLESALNGVSTTIAHVEVEEKLEQASSPVEEQESSPVEERASSSVEEKVEAENMKEPAEAVKEAPAPAPRPAAAATPAASKPQSQSSNVEVPPIKKEIETHFNKLDESGRLLNVFRQYYTCLNDACGSPVRVTIKDGFCSLWNYDEWEEFAFVDIFEGHLRFAVDPRYTDALSALSLCEVPRLLSSRRSLVCVQVGDLNNTMLEVLAKAFEEVGISTK